MTTKQTARDFLLRRIPLGHGLREWTEDPETGCWIATHRGPNGYAYNTSFEGRKGNAYRLAWELVRGMQVPKGYHLDHYVCDNGPGGCMNPDHLRLSTPKANILRSQNACANYARQTHCKEGHPLEGDNLRIVQRKNGHASRICVTCQDERQPRYFEKHSPEELNEKRRAHYARKREEILAVKQERLRRKKLGLPIGRGAYEDLKKETG